MFCITNTSCFLSSSASRMYEEVCMLFSCEAALKQCASYKINNLNAQQKEKRFYLTENLIQHENTLKATEKVHAATLYHIWLSFKHSELRSYKGILYFTSNSTYTGHQRQTKVIYFVLPRCLQCSCSISVKIWHFNWVSKMFLMHNKQLSQIYSFKLQKNRLFHY